MRDPFLDARVAAMIGIFLISLVAVSFPAISRRSSVLSRAIPKILFFIGKHFGTGVILSTAFAHLLEDSFESLQNPAVKEKYPRVGKQTGLIILASLLTIFLVEYITTSYVDHLHAEPSAPSSPASNSPRLQPAEPAVQQFLTPAERTPLLSGAPARDRRPPEIVVPNSAREHYLTSIITNSPRYSRSNENFYIINDLKHHLRNGEYHLLEQGKCLCVSVCADDGRAKGLPTIQDDGHGHTGDEKPRVGRKRQVIGILVLQLGIMIHSFVIGLTLALTSGADFTSLVTAIVFHQFFEGLSLGIRMAGLPPSSHAHELLHSPPESMRQRVANWMCELRVRWLQPTLSFLFAVTTPLGMALGILIFNNEKGSEAKMLLTQGLMSAVSAGMLIYAATVEMLGGDFVFGNLGGHSHGHSSGGHGHSHGEELIESLDGSEGNDDDEVVSVQRKVVAVVSLLGGVLAMGLVGLGE